MSLKYIVNILFAPILIPIYYLRKNIKRKSNIWIFGAWFGERYSDNSKYLFLYIKSNVPSVRPIWITRNNGVLKILRESGYEAYKTCSFRGIWFSLCCGCVILSCDLTDVNYYATTGALEIQLFHGIPLKKIGYDTNTKYRILNKIRNLFLPYINHQADFYIATSPEVQKNIITAFDIKDKKVVITGLPRNDALFDSVWLKKDSEIICRGLQEFINGKKVITYLPTHRSNKNNQIDLLTDYLFDPHRISDELGKRECVLLIKSHFYNSKNSDCIKDSKNIKVLDNLVYSDIYPILYLTDILLTDYSSVFFDYLLLDRPIIFTPFDIDNYMKYDRQMYYSYDSVTPGPKAANWNEVIDIVDKILADDIWKEDRRRMIAQFHTYQDKCNSKRVADFILTELEK